MLYNYLAFSLAILLTWLHLRRIGRAPGYSLLGAIVVAAAFKITPGLSWIAGLLGAWLFVIFKPVRVRWRLPVWCSERARRRVCRNLRVTPLLHPTVPFLIHLPGIDTPLAPSVRLMALIEAARMIAEHPWFGASLGAGPIALDYLAPSGEHQVLTDAHNVYLTSPCTPAWSGSRQC